MKAVTWHGRHDVRVEEVPDPKIELLTDAIIQITTTNICGSDLHLYEPLAAFMSVGDILGHESMGIVQEVGSEAGDLRVGDRVVIPFQISWGDCWMCQRGLYPQCETTQVRDQGSGAALFVYSKLYGEVPGGQAEYLRVPQAQFTHIKVRTAPQMTVSPTCPTFCPPPGRPWSTRRSRMVAPSSCLALAPLVTSRHGSAPTKDFG
jgi:threonine dehydrogenase-like Zn-dependent dehydrogenase